MQVDINCKNHPYLLYALTESGVTYLLKIRNISSYSSSSTFPPDDLLISFDMRAYGPITSAAVSASGCFVVGRNDGSVGCFQLGTLDPTSPGIMKFILLAVNLEGSVIIGLYICACFQLKESMISAYIVIIGFSSASYLFLMFLSYPFLAFVNELRDDSGIGRLWGLMSRYYKL